MLLNKIWRTWRVTEVEDESEGKRERERGREIERVRKREKPSQRKERDAGMEGNGEQKELEFGNETRERRVICCS
jgi:hypothetical protein